MVTYFFLYMLFLLFSFTIADHECSFDQPQRGKFQLCADQFDTVVIGENATLHLFTSQDKFTNVTSVELQIIVKHEGIVQLYQNTTDIVVSEDTNITVHAIGAGRTEISFNYTNDSDFDTINHLEHVVRTVNVVHSYPLNVIIAIIGWMYFAAWSVSFYPQIFLNFYRRSVVGLNFDFLAFNITGFLAYSMFNIGLYWIPEVEAEYFNKNPGGVNPVQLNDVIFAVHASLATIVTILQCFIFERGGQRISILGGIILVILWGFMIISLFVAVGNKLAWLEYLYFVSYVKLAVTLMKYVPQAYLNFKRKSTVGWSIGNILLDFTGGTLSILQMILISYNYDDWQSIFGDPTKFGLGAFSIAFDLVFMTQHYILYRHPPPPKDGYTKIEDGEDKPLLGEEHSEEINNLTFVNKIRLSFARLLAKFGYKSSMCIN